MIQGILRIWTRIEAVLIGLLLLVALFVFLGGAALRTLAPLHSVDWAEEVALYAIIWATALAGSSLVAEGRHINTEVFVALLPGSIRHLVGWSMTALSVAFCAAMMHFGWQAFEFALLLDERSASSLRVQQGWAVFLALPVGMALIVGRVGLMLAAGERPFGGEAPSHAPRRS